MSVAEKMTAIADAIREKTGDTAKLSLDGMAEALRKLPGPIVATASGNPIALTDATDLKLRGLKLYGKTTQNGTPTPEAPVPLVSAGDGGSVGVTVAGKNLLKVDFTQSTDRGITFTPTDDGGVKVSGTTQNYPYKAIGRVFLCTGVLYSVTLNGTVLPKLALRVINRDVDPASIAVSSENTFTPKVTGWHKFEITINPGFDGETTLYPMVEIGQTATEYEPYKGQPLTVSTPNGLPGIPVTSGGNYTDEAGQQWVCDEVDFARGVYVQRVQEYVFKGKEPVTAPYWDSTGFCYSIGNYGMPKPTVGTETTKVLCNYLSGTNAIATNEMVYFRNIGSFSSQAEASTYLKGLYESGNPFTIQYVIATPIETPLSAEELAAYAALHTNYPNTTIFNDGGAGMEISYVADTKLYIDNKINAMAAAIVNA